jgi:type III pantothenate kinase
MLLAVDVGNTNVTLALFDGDRLAADWRVTSHRERTADEVAVELRQLFELRGFQFDVVTGVVIASVVPNLNPALVEASRRYLRCEPVMVGPGVRTSVRIRYENPKDVGADRIANALAAYTKYGGPVVVIDFGTAVTYDAINAEGEYLGGAIAPGVEISLDALVSQTAMLRRVEPVAPGHLDPVGTGLGVRRPGRRDGQTDDRRAWWQGSRRGDRRAGFAGRRAHPCH